MLSVIMLNNAIMPSVITMSAFLQSYYTDCHVLNVFVQRHYEWCRFAECRGALF
jgi:hypothetical protein